METVKERSQKSKKTFREWDGSGGREKQREIEREAKKRVRDKDGHRSRQMEIETFDRKNGREPKKQRAEPREERQKRSGCHPHTQTLRLSRKTEPGLRTLGQRLTCCSADCCDVAGQILGTLFHQRGSIC